jgi:hypothetical protein
MASGLPAARGAPAWEATPAPTKLALLGTVALTGAMLLAFLRSTPGTEVEPRTTGYVLGVLAGLFFLRVTGQLIVRACRPRWLPPMRDWNLMPYRFLLPIQIAFLVTMGFICYDLVRRAGVFATPSPAFGHAAVWFSYAYASAVAVRYAVRMIRRPEQRWFGGAIPIVFHWVLATFVFVYGSFHASY